MFDMQTARILYRKLLSFYPQRFKEQLGESMEQTFNDLYRERQRDHELPAFLFWTFVETSAAITREHALVWAQGDSMKAILSNPTSAAIVSLILSLPLALLYIIFNLDITIFTLDIKPLAALVTSWLTVNGSEINGLGRLVLIGGLLSLPVAFVINLLPLLKKEGPEARRKLHTANIIVGIIILIIILVSWGGLFVEEIYCLQGIRCD
jgi:hypothetical protein